MTTASKSIHPNPFVRRPTLVSSAIAVVAGIVVVGLIAETSLQRRIVAAAVVGIASFALGGRMWHRNRDAIGAILALCGGLLLLVTIGYTASQPPQFVHRLELLPGLVGLWVLATALVPLRFRWSRLFIDVGTGLLFVTVLTSGVVRGTSTTALVIAAAATILAWDAAENAVSMGGQVGAYEAVATARSELVHVGVSGAIAGIAVLIILGVANLGIDGLPFAALIALLVGVVALILAYHR